MTDEQRLDKLFQKALQEIEKHNLSVAPIDPLDLPVRSNGNQLVISKDDRYKHFSGNKFMGRIKTTDGTILESGGHDNKITAASEVLRHFRSTNRADAEKLSDALDTNLDAWWFSKTKNAPGKTKP
jgi:hypothetical protein